MSVGRTTERDRPSGSVRLALAVSLSALVHGYASTHDQARMVNQFHLMMAGMRTRPWLEYVPSLANIADLPSRGKFELLERLGARRVEVPVVGVTDWSAPLASWMERAAAFATAAET